MKVLSFEHPTGRRNRSKILRAIVVLGNPSPREIKLLLDKEAENLVQNPYSAIFIPPEKMKGKIMKETMSERTIFFWLRRLKKEGMVTHQNNRYSLSEGAGNDVEFIAGMYGSAIYSNIWDLPLAANPEEYLVEIVDRLGVFLVYMFLYSLQPFRADVETKKEDLEALRNSWVNNGIPLFLIYQFFRYSLGLLTISTNQAKKIEVSEINEKQYKRLNNILKKKYPLIFDAIRVAISDFNKTISNLAAKQK
jgi:hypothetical protein